MLGKKLFKKQKSIIETHTKARGNHYDSAEGGIAKFEVPDDKVSWKSKLKNYEPVPYTIKLILEKKPVWADPDVLEKEAFSKIKFNALDGKVNRVSHTGSYKIVDGLPLNPVGRTGVTGRGQLGKWGPNHAADPVVTRWKRDDQGNIIQDENGKKILEFVCIQRKDTKEWAIPGGMVDAGEEVSLTMKREFGEEAMNTMVIDHKEDVQKAIEELFTKGEIIYKGYNDDPRNTDNAWMETVVCNFHDEEGTSVAKMPLHGGDDAAAARWLSIDKPLELFSSHALFIQEVCKKRGAYFAPRSS